MGTRAMTQESPSAEECPGKNCAVDSAVPDAVPSATQTTADQAPLGQDDDITVVVSREGPWSLHKPTLGRVMAALAIAAVGFFATGLARRAMARHPARNQAASAADATFVTAENKAVVAAPAPSLPVSAAPAQAPVPQAPADGNASSARCRDALASRDLPAITQSCERALDLDTTLATPILEMARHELDRGNIKAAATWARRVLAADDRLADAYLIVGVAEQEASHASAAKTAYWRYLELAPKGRYARDVRSSLAAY